MRQSKKSSIASTKGSPHSRPRLEASTPDPPLRSHLLTNGPSSKSLSTSPLLRPSSSTGFAMPCPRRLSRRSRARSPPRIPRPQSRTQNRRPRPRPSHRRLRHARSSSPPFTRRSRTDHRVRRNLLRRPALFAGRAPANRPAAQLLRDASPDRPPPHPPRCPDQRDSPIPIRET